jgi:hypothetical protein
LLLKPRLPAPWRRQNAAAKSLTNSFGQKTPIAHIFRPWGPGNPARANKDGDLAFVGHFESLGHDASLAVVSLVAVADPNDGDRSDVLDENNAPIANPKPCAQSSKP